MRQSALLVLLTGCLLGAGSPGQAFDPASVYPTEAAFTASLAPLRTAIERNPRDVRSRFLLGYAYFSAWRLYQVGIISYGATYDRPAEAEFRAIIRMDPNHLGAHLALYILLQCRGEWEAAEVLLPRLLRLLVQAGAVPRPPSPPPAPWSQVTPEQSTVVPPPDVRFRPEDDFVIVDLATGLIYRLNCLHLPRIERGAFFLIKWEAIVRGYRPATGPCAP